MRDRQSNRVVAAGRRLAPWLGVVNLTLALLTYLTGRMVGWLLFSIAAVTVLAGLVFALGYLFSPEGLRSTQQLGFQSNRAFLLDASSPTGTRAGPHLLAAASVIVALITGWLDTPAGVLALSSVILSIAWSVITTRWPADRLQ